MQWDSDLFSLNKFNWIVNEIPAIFPTPYLYMTCEVQFIPFAKNCLFPYKICTFFHLADVTINSKTGKILQLIQAVHIICCSNFISDFKNTINCVSVTATAMTIFGKLIEMTENTFCVTQERYCLIRISCYSSPSWFKAIHSSLLLVPTHKSTNLLRTAN